MKLYQLRQIYDDIIIPKYKEFGIDKPLLFIGADVSVPNSSGIYYDKEEQMWLKYSYNDYSQKFIWGHFHTDEEAADNLYEELMAPILSKQEAAMIVGPTPEEYNSRLYLSNYLEQPLKY